MKKKSGLERDIRAARYDKDRRAEVDAEEKIKEGRPVLTGEGNRGEEICPSCDLVSLVCTGRAPVRSAMQGEYHYRCLACGRETDMDQYS